MTSSLTFNGNVTLVSQTPPLRDTFTTALVKNLIVVLVWLVLSYINSLLIATFFRHQTFYEDPRYILFIHMVINDALMLTTSVLLFLLSYTIYRINVSFCSILILMAVVTDKNTAINLAGMAIERYIAVCRPLRYSQICTVRRTHMFIGLNWFLMVTLESIDLFVMLATEPLSFFYDSLFCIRHILIKNPILSLRRQAFDMIYFSSVFLIIVFTYTRVHLAARASSTNVSAKKCRNTILLHGIQLAICLFTYLSPLMQFNFPDHYGKLRFAIFIFINILPRFLSPIIYGMRDQNFRKYLRMYLLISGGCRAADNMQH